MDLQKRFATQALIITLLFNAALLALIVVVWGVQGSVPALLGTGLIVTLALWVALRQAARPLLRQAAGGPAAPEAVTPASAPKPLPRPEHPYEAAAVQVLALLQRQGRLIDFLQEDLQAYDDAQIGAAVRSVHDGCKRALAEIADLEPVLDQAEGTRVTIEPGFDAYAIRLTGHVAGDPPFSGILQHRGWRLTRLELPEKLTADQTKIVAPAEVEVG